jgi:hypothetical protein
MTDRYRYLSLETNINDIENNLNSYLQFLFIIGLFYILPSMQFIFFQQSSNITCYYNFKCKHKLGIIPSFNNFISNLGYILLGIIFIITVKLRKNQQESVLIINKSLYYCLGLCLIYEGISSALYHICPSRLNLQFDTTFMFIGIIMCYLCLYNNKHLGHVCKPFKFYLILFLVMILNVLSLVKNKNTTHWWLWIFTFILVLYCCILTSIYVFIGRKYDLDYESFKEARRLITKEQLKNTKFWFIVGGNICTYSLFLYSAINDSYFIGTLLGIAVFNLALYFAYYLIYKIQKNEKIETKFKIFIVLDLLLFIISLYFFFHTEYNTFIDIEESNKLNRKCILFNFFDSHDLWHIVSAFALYTFMNIIFFIDDETILNFNSIAI